MDFILNGAPSGDVATRLLQYNGDVGCLRPFIGKDGRNYMTVNTGKFDDKGQPIRRTMVTNAPTTLRKDDWILLDGAIMRAARARLRAVADLRSAGLTYTIPNGMAKTVLEYEMMSDITPAAVSMDGLRKSDADRPTFDLAGLPLPITHKDFHFSLRQLMVSRNSNTPLDTTTAELAGRQVAEEIERQLLGISTVANEYAYAGHTVYGYTNFPDRLTHTMKNPTDGDWTPAHTVQDILAMKSQSIDAYHYGPWVLYVSPEWTQYLDDDYSASKGDNTLRERIGRIDSISSIRVLDFLTGKQMLLVQQSSDVIRLVVGMDFTTIQWETHGGMQLNYKVMAIMVPQLRADINGRTGIVHATAAAATTTTT